MIEGYGLFCGSTGKKMWSGHIRGRAMRENTKKDRQRVLEAGRKGKGPAAPPIPAQPYLPPAPLAARSVSHA